MTYDSVGRVVKETIGGVEKRFVRDGDRVIQERDANNQVVEEYFWDGGRLLKRGTGANSSYVQSNISGTPLRFTDNTGEFTGGVLYSRMGEKVIAVNEDGWKIGFGGMRKSGPLPFMFDEYVAPLAMSLGARFGGIWDALPQIPFPTASHQGVFADLQSSYLPDEIQGILQGANQATGGKPGVSPDTPPSRMEECTNCCLPEGTSKVEGLAPNVPGCEPVKPVFKGGVTGGGVHRGEPVCLESCINPVTGAWTIKPGKQGHCCNEPPCCKVMAECKTRGKKCYIPGCVETAPWKKRHAPFETKESEKALKECCTGPCCDAVSATGVRGLGVLSPQVDCLALCLCLAGQFPMVPRSRTCAYPCETACSNEGKFEDQLRAGIQAFFNCLGGMSAGRLSCALVCIGLIENPVAYYACVAACESAIGAIGGRFLITSL